MAMIESWFEQDLKKPVQVRMIGGNVFSQDNQGNLIGVIVKDNGETAALGGTVSANIIRADGQTVAQAGTLSGNKCSVILPAAAYAVPGSLIITLKLTHSGVITTLLAVVATVYRSSTDTIVDPGTILESVQDLIDDIETATAAIPVGYNACFAPGYSTSGTYAVGNYVTYNGYLYRCVSAISSGESWTAAHWKQVPIGGDVSGLTTALNNGVLAENNLESMWEMGAISSSTGANSSNTSTTRIRTSGYIHDHVRALYTNGAYEYVLAAYSGGTYVGMWNGNSFETSATWLSGYTAINQSIGYDYRIVLRKSGDATIQTADCAGINLFSVTDKALEKPAVAADAKIVGEKIGDIHGAVYAANPETDLMGDDTDNGYISGYIISSSQGIVEASGRFISEYIAVYPGQHVLMNYNLGSNVYAHELYDENKVHVGYVISNEDNEEFDIPDHARYIRFSGALARKALYRVRINVPSMQVVADYEAIFGGLNSIDNDPGKTTVKLSDVGCTQNSVFSVRAFRVVTNRPNTFLTDPIPVDPGMKIILNYDMNSGTYGHAFYDSNDELVSAITSEFSNREFVVPNGCHSIRLSGFYGRRNLYTITFETGKENIFKKIIKRNARDILKTTNEPFYVGETEYNHVAFPSMCYFAGKRLVCYRYGKSHTTPTDSANWGGVQLAVYDGVSFSPVITLTADMFNEENDGISGGNVLEGELRDTQIQPTRDGQYLLLATWTTYYDNGETYHDNLLVCIDQSFNIVDYRIDKYDSSTDEVTRHKLQTTEDGYPVIDEHGQYVETDEYETVRVKPLYWGNPIQTPEGHIIVSGYASKGGLYLYRSSEVFDGTVKNLTMQRILVHSDRGYNWAENCVGYYGNRLYMIARRADYRGDSGEITNSVLLSTSNTEGTDGWNAPADVGVCIHAPKLFPYWKDGLLPFFGAVLVTKNRDRYPGFGVIEIGENSLTSYIGNVDKSLSANYGGYCGAVRKNDNEFEMTYYEETVLSLSSLNGSTGVYLRDFNMFEVVPELIYKI